ncbi:MAG: hypothetical protein ACTSVI_16425 [Promethearchaeota archaeon]
MAVRKVLFSKRPSFLKKIEVERDSVSVYSGVLDKVSNESSRDDDK